MEYDRRLVSFYELESEWQEEAYSNYEEDAYEITFVEPKPEQNPREHVLQDLSECMRTDSNSEFDGIITVSNVCAIGVNISPCGEACRLTYI